MKILARLLITICIMGTVAQNLTCSKYKSYDKNFKWDGSDLSPGVYFYYIKYTKSDYRGTVTIVY